MRVNELHGVLGVERAPSGERLVKDDPERVEVRPVVDAAVHAARLLGGDVGQDVGDHLGRVEPLVRASELGVDAKPDDLDLAARIDKQTLRPQIAMDETCRVHGGEPFGEGGGDIERLTNLELA